MNMLLGIQEDERISLYGDSSEQLSLRSDADTPAEPVWSNYHYLLYLIFTYFCPPIFLPTNPSAHVHCLSIRLQIALPANLPFCLLSHLPVYLLSSYVNICSALIISHHLKHSNWIFMIMNTTAHSFLRGNIYVVETFHYFLQLLRVCNL